MANNYDASDGVWRTIGGRRVFIKDGQSLYDAMKESGKFKNLKEKTKEKEKKFDDHDYQIGKGIYQQVAGDKKAFLQKMRQDYGWDNEDAKALYEKNNGIWEAMTNKDLQKEVMSDVQKSFEGVKVDLKGDTYSTEDGRTIKKGEAFEVKDASSGYSIEDLKKDGYNIEKGDQLQVISKETDGYFNVKNLRTGETIEGLSEEHLGEKQDRSFIVDNPPKDYEYNPKVIKDERYWNWVEETDPNTNMSDKELERVYASTFPDRIEKNEPKSILNHEELNAFSGEKYKIDKSDTNKEWLSKEEKSWIDNQGHGEKLDKKVDNFKPSGDIETDERRLNNMASDYFYDEAGIYNENIDSVATKWAHDKALELNKANEKSDWVKENERSIKDLRELAKEKHNEDYDKYYGKYAKERENYLNQYDKYKNPIQRPEKMEGRDIWHPGYQESLYDQVQNAINTTDNYDLNGIENTLAIVEKEASGSLHNRYLQSGGKLSEQYDRKTYGNAKVDSALMREQELLHKGYSDIHTDMAPRGMVNDFDYSDMIISGEKNGIQVSFNYNKDGKSAITLQGHKGIGYGNLVITDENAKDVRDIISRGSIGGFQESRPYKDYEVKKLTIPESKEYYDKANAYYRENKDAHYYDNKFFNDYNEKLKDEIIARRGQASMSDKIRDEAYRKYMQSHPNSKMTLEQFLKKKK